MKKIISLFICSTLILTGCSFKNNIDSNIDEEAKSTEVADENISNLVENEEFEENLEFDSLDDPKLLEYLQDSIYADLEYEFASDDYIVENISTIYYPKEYLEEISSNSKSNVWFGYTIEELEEQFDGIPYVFTLADDGSTEVIPLNNYDDTYERVIKNVAIGAGVIFFCVTVSVISAEFGQTKISMIFASSAKEATTMALSYGAISGTIAATVTGFQTKDFDQTKKETLLKASESFKYGAIVGAIKGGVEGIIGVNTPTQNSKNAVKSVRERAEEAEKRALAKYGGTSQVSYLDGTEVPYGTADATRPDIVRKVGDTLEAIEVKYYDLSNPQCVNRLGSELQRQVGSRIINLPQGSIQRIVLDVTDRGFSTSIVDNAIQLIREALSDIYPNIPIDVIGV